MGLSLRGFLVAGIISLSSAAAFGEGSKTAFPPCTTTATEADRKAAQGAFAAGQGSFNEADYPTAITYWRDAYRRDCSAHALLLNLARAFELKGDRSEAVNALETYLQRKPDAADADQIRRRIENLKSQITAAEKPVAPAAPPAAAAAAAPTAPSPSAPLPVAAPPPTDTAETGRSRSPLPLFVAGGGGVLAIVGAVVFVGGVKKVQDAEADCPTHTCPHDTPPDIAAAAIEKGNAGRQEQLIGGVLLGAGIAAAGGGVLWYLLSSPSSDAPAKATSPLRRAVATPAIGPGYAGISLGGAF
jgi:tetratricopeptide (TPR) repeat protein